MKGPAGRRWSFSVGVLSVFDVFCGAGGLSAGFAAADGFEVTAGVDSDTDAVSSFAANHRSAAVAAVDVAAVPACDVAGEVGLRGGNVDVVVGGPPCQGFTSVRPRRSSGIDDPRNSLFGEFAAFVGLLAPRVFVMENVPAMVSHHGGRVLATAVAAMRDVGYRTEWRVLDAADFGVPQRRRRLFLVGIRESAASSAGSGSGSWPWPSPTHSPAGPPGAGCALTDRPIPGLTVDGALPAVTADEAVSDLPVLAPGESAETYTGPPVNEYQAARRPRSSLDGAASRLSWHAAVDHSERMQAILVHAGDSIAAIPKSFGVAGYSTSYSRIAGSRPAPTLTGNFIHAASATCVHPHQHRSLTVREGARLQSFDDGWEFRGTRSKVARQIGNAVPPLLAAAVAGMVRELAGCDTARRASQQSRQASR